MSSPFHCDALKKPPSATRLLSSLRRQMHQLPDARRTATANHLKYSVADAALSAFSVFFTQSPSFLDYQVRLKKAHNRSNAESIFGIHQIPSMNQTRNLLDSVPAQALFPCLQQVAAELEQAGHLEPLRSVNQTLLLALDGTDFFSSNKISCSCCTQQALANGKTRYRHSAVTPVIVSPHDKRVIPLAPEFVTPQDGHEKQDCEIAAAKRWLATWGVHYAPWKMTLLGDDLYCHQPFVQAAIAQGFDVLLTCLPSSHQTVAEWIGDFERNQQLQTHTIKKPREGTYRYRYIHQIPLRNSDDAILLNWLELTVIDASGEQTYQQTWMTTHELTEKTVADVAKAGRSRWSIENGNNNILKNHGYHFDHNFGHGKQHLSNLLATLIILAFSLHTALEWFDETYQTVRALSSSRRTFFEQLRALLQFIPFKDWEHLMLFMLEGQREPDT